MKSKSVIFILTLMILGSVKSLNPDFIKKNEIQENITSVIQSSIDGHLGKEEDLNTNKIQEEENTSKNAADSFTYGPLPETIIYKIKGVSWKEDAPVGLEDLCYVKVLHWGFDDKEHSGELVVHKKVAKEVTDIFKELYEAKFPIEKIRLIDEYDANDDLSMEDNNTSAFCFREVAGKKGVLSKHSYGVAIDINPVQNPYVKGDHISPKAGREYVDRKKVKKGIIVKDDICYRAFKERGWTWGGEWKTLKDYQHFQKKID